MPEAEVESPVAGLNLDFSTSPTVFKFVQCRDFVSGIKGPVGSGKSYGSAARVMIHAVEQAVSPVDNIRYSRFAVIRNSYPELRTTTIKTWQDLFPEDVWGPMRWSPPITHHLKLPPRGNHAGIDCEVIFLALDQPKDVRKLLSLELTGAWVNEARELPKSIIDGVTSRVGRYPTARDGGATWRGVWMDTNPMDDDHWWHILAEKEKITGRYAWKFFNQPGGVIEVGPDELPDKPEMNGFQFSAGKWWRVNPKAENIGNLPNGYYNQMLAGKTLDWIRCYVEGKYVYVQDGKPVWHEYDDHAMCSDVVYDPSIPLHIGLDFGLTPAAVFGQRHPSGQWRVLYELVTFDIGLQKFGEMLVADLQSRFPKAEVFIWGDPAGMKRDEIYEVTAFDFLKTLGLNARPTVSNAFKVRREAGAAPMNRLVQGRPGLLVHSCCKQLRKSLSGGYHFKRVGMGGGQERFRDEPNKNQWSHVGDAYGYLMTGGGEHRELTRARAARFEPTGGQTIAQTDFDIF
jgi:hypothetical protein